MISYEGSTILFPSLPNATGIDSYRALNYFVACHSKFLCTTPSLCLNYYFIAESSYKVNTIMR